MVVDLGKPEVLVGQVAELLQGALHGEIALLHLLEELLQAVGGYGNLLVGTPPL